MGIVSSLLEQKRRDGNLSVASVSPSSTVLEAAQLMNDRHIGAAIVLDADRLVGVFTERDVLTRVVAECRAPAETTVGEVMTSPVVVCRPETSLGEVRTVMREKRIRHLPVVNGGAVVGMISIGDLNAAEARSMVETITYLEQYMYKP